jgi:hypothetical protein
MKVGYQLIIFLMEFIFGKIWIQNVRDIDF